MKPHKYNAVRTTVDNITFASKAEARRYSELKLMEKAGHISALELQPRFDLHAPERGSGCDRKVATYIADFRYRLGVNGLWVIEDVKSQPTKTAIYRLKKKIVEAEYGITITEITRRR